MMGQYLHPKCCGCNGDACGRICYAGKYNNVVDNPFCKQCFSEIFRQTVRLLKAVYPNETKGEFVLIQRWENFYNMPNMPFTISKLMTDGQRISHEV